MPTITFLNCRHCGEPIVGLPTRSGKRVFINNDTYSNFFNEKYYNPLKHDLHSNTCIAAIGGRVPEDELPNDLDQS